MTSKRFKLRLWHKWLGIFGALFLINLGITGFILDHRQWNWLYTDAVSLDYFNDEFAKDAQKHGSNTLSLMNKNHKLSGGNRGLWWSDDQAYTWEKANFVSRKHAPIVTAIVQTSSGIVVSTGDGVWRSIDHGKTLNRFALEGQFVNALSIDSARGGLIGVVDRSRIFRLNPLASQPKFVVITAPNVEQLPTTVTLSRFVYDVHFGRGVFGGMWSWLWSDYAGISMVLLSIIGIIMWRLPKYYIKKSDKGEAVSSATRQAVYQWLHRSHAPLLGVVASIPILYLSLTGILIDHSKELRPWMKSVDISRLFLPPVYEMRSLDEEIYGAVTHTSAPDSLTIGTRYGIFDSSDNGKTWSYNSKVVTFVKEIRREGETIVIKGMGGPDYTKKEGESWVEKPKSHCGDTQKSPKPPVVMASWFDIIDGLHTGNIIASWWNWANDIFAMIATLLVVSGALRWWKRKW